jgi:hypothetical protein
MSTHVPINTGYGRASLSGKFLKGQDAIYTSNSMNTAEGYTYMVTGMQNKVKRPTDFHLLTDKTGSLK